MKICFGLLCCGLSLGTLAQQKAPVDSLQKLRQDTTVLGRRIVMLRQRVDKAQIEFMRCHDQAFDVQQRRDSLHAPDPAVYKARWDSLTAVLIKRGLNALEAQDKFESVLVQLDSTLGVYNTAVQRLQGAARGRK